MLSLSCVIMCVLPLYSPSSHIRSPDKVTLVQQNCSSWPIWLYRGCFGWNREETYGFSSLIKHKRRCSCSYKDNIWWLKSPKLFIRPMRYIPSLRKPYDCFVWEADQLRGYRFVFLTIIYFLLLCLGWTNFHLSPFRQFCLQPMPLYFLTGNLPPKGLTFQEFELIGNS